MHCPATAATDHRARQDHARELKTYLHHHSAVRASVRAAFLHRGCVYHTQRRGIVTLLDGNRSVRFWEFSDPGEPIDPLTE